MYLKICKSNNILERIENEIKDNETGLYFVEIQDDSNYQKYNKYDIVKIIPNNPLTEIEQNNINKTRLEDRKQKLLERKNNITNQEQINKIDERLTTINNKLAEDSVFPVNRNEIDITIQHRFTEAQANDIDNLIYNNKIDKETYNKIKEWCKIQPEGCEEAFLSLDKTSQRFQDYENKKQEIKNNQAIKKITITSDLTKEMISELLK